MAREDLISALKLAEEFVYDPEEALLFSGRSLRDILMHLRTELENTDVDESDVVAAWVKNAPAFRKLLIISARRGTRVTVGGRSRILIREEDALAATEGCPKGPDYHRPGW